MVDIGFVSSVITLPNRTIADWKRCQIVASTIAEVETKAEKEQPTRWWAVQEILEARTGIEPVLAALQAAA
jgi:hypothetical protein